MDLSMLANGMRINSMALVKKLKLTAPNMRGSIKMAKKMELENYIFQMDLIMKGCFQMETLTALEHMFGLIKGSTQESGRIIECMAKEQLAGRITSHLLGITKMILKTAKESLNGLMEGPSMEAGLMENKLD